MRLSSSQMFLCAQKSQKAQDVKRFFFLTVLCAQKCYLLYLLMCVLYFLCLSSSQMLVCTFKTAIRLCAFLCLQDLFVKGIKLSKHFFFQTFYGHKNAVFFICLCPFGAYCTKQATFFLFNVFIRVKTVFVFICLCAFYVFYACEVQNFPNTIIYYTTSGHLNFKLSKQ